MLILEARGICLAKGTTSETLKDETRAIKEFLKAAASAVLGSPEDLKRARQATGLSKSALEQMKIYGKGSSSAWIRLLAYAAKIPLADLPIISAKFRTVVSEVNQLNDFERLLEEARRHYNENELYAWLRLLVARAEIEESLGLKKSRHARL